ncbi:efflux RND transporter periplasmic adaptor subunit [Campylobacter concisus]|jgi:efflux transporter, RND family, MFP subunit|uniref:efflux RND transporter periplasmic adaptor subunit n=1 Tax=Campylobacter concisus TaxID=199 RepID=UPI000CD9E1CF|nr:efflux RND transporter periplasmic adaptor subunit [Campylobacter concisus]MCA6130102.1 efflux RND transporter periplasmic adaptor subunit [Campylobacter concisus]MCA6131995.1 efflux RND transporter periplasmic adaptor subunit [Campylobacter concisus]
MKKSKILIILLILGVGGYFVYDKFFNIKDEKVEFITKKAKKGSFSKKVDATGEIFATELIDVGAQVSGQIKKLYVKLGDQVKKGDMIASIDSSTQQNSIDNKEAQLAIYKAQLESAKVALNIAKTQFDRENALFAKNATSKQEFESAKNTFSSNSAKIKELEAQIKQTNIELSTAKINLGYTKITAPRDGTVVSVQVEEGQTVNANQTTPTIVNIADLSHVKMKMQIAEGDITKIKVGTPVEYSILSEPTKKFQTTVSSIDPGLTTLSDGSYGSSSSSKSSYSSSSSSSSAVYYYAQSIVDNKDGILRIGMTTQNELLIANVEDAIIVPSIGIKKDENGTFVYVLKDGKPVKTAVKTGIKDNLDTQIISGINEGDEIITSQGSSSEIAKMIAKEHKKF